MQKKIQHKEGAVFYEEQHAVNNHAAATLLEAKRLRPKHDSITRIVVNEKEVREFYSTDKAIKFVTDALTKFGGCQSARMAKYFRTYFMTSKPAAVITPMSFGYFTLQVGKHEYKKINLKEVQSTLDKHLPVIYQSKTI